MNDRIRELARQSGGIDVTNHMAGGTTTWIGTGTPEFLERFAELIRADEREQCAKVAESYEPLCDICPGGVSTAIRARGKE